MQKQRSLLGTLSISTNEMAKNKKVPSAFLQMALWNTVNYARLRHGSDTV